MKQIYMNITLFSPNHFRSREKLFHLTVVLLLALVFSVAVRGQSDDHDHHNHEFSHEDNTEESAWSDEHGESSAHHDDEAELRHEGEHDKEDDIHDDHDSHSGHEEADHHDEHGHNEPISLDPRDMEDFGIKTATAGQGTLREELRLPGEVRVNENAMGHVRPRFDGIVTGINKFIGDRVTAGEVLAEMESNETLRPFQLKAPISGTIVAYHITPGEAISTGDVAYVITDTSTVWIDLRVYQRDLPRIHKGLSVSISAGHTYPRVEGTIAYVGPTIDEVTRSGLVRAVIDNPEGFFRPGLFVTGSVLLDEQPFPVVVPRTAVLNVEDQSVVFVKSIIEDGFELREVKIGFADGGYISIVSGLMPGDVYVVEGGFYLKADSQKESFGDGHAH